MYLFMDKWHVTRLRKYHQSKERVKLEVDLFPKFRLRSPKVIYQVQNDKIGLMYLFMEKQCAARPRNHHQSNDRVKLQVGLFPKFRCWSLKVNNQGDNVKIDIMYLFMEQRCVTRH